MNAPYVTAISTADRAVELLTGARAQSYGDPLAEFERIGRMWAGLLDLDDIRAQPAERLRARGACFVLREVENLDASECGGTGSGRCCGHASPFVRCSRVSVR